MNSNVFLICGNTYDVDNTVASIVEKTKSDNIVRIDAEDTSKSSVSEHLLMGDIFSQIKVVLVRGYPRGAGKDQNYVLNLIPKIPDNNIVIFYSYTSLKKYKKFYNYMSDECKFREFNSESRKVSDILIEIFNKNKKTIEKKEADKIADYIGNNHDAAITEAGKIISYVGRKKKITFDDAREVCCMSREFVIWEMISSVALKKEVQSLSLLEDAFNDGCSSEFILTMLLRSVRLSLMLKDLMKDNSADESISKIKQFTKEKNDSGLGRSPAYGDYEIKKTCDQSNSFYATMSMNELLVCFDNIVNSMIKIRMSSSERDKQTVMVMLIISICLPKCVRISF